MIAETLFGMSEACWILTIAGILLLALAVIGTIKLVSCETARHGLAKVLTFTVVCMWMCYIAADVVPVQHEQLVWAMSAHDHLERNLSSI